VATTEEAQRMHYATQLSQIHEDEAPIVAAFYMTQLRAVKKVVQGVVGPAPGVAASTGPT